RRFLPPGFGARFRAEPFGVARFFDAAFRTLRGRRGPVGAGLPTSGIVPPGRFDFGSVATTRSYDVLTSGSSSRRSSTFPSSCSWTHMFRAMYGAGMIPGRSTSSPNVSGVHLNAIECGGSRSTTVNILLPTRKHRSCPHLTSSVTAGRARQIARTVSSVMARSYGRVGPIDHSFIAQRADRIETRGFSRRPEARDDRDD